MMMMMMTRCPHCTRPTDLGGLHDDDDDDDDGGIHDDDDGGVHDDDDCTRPTDFGGFHSDDDDDNDDRGVHIVLDPQTWVVYIVMMIMITEVSTLYQTNRLGWFT